MKVLAFGTFDPLHGGHRDFFRQARRQGGRLLVVVARDSYVRVVKKREPRVAENRRLKQVAKEPSVDEVRLGDDWPVVDPYRLLDELEFDVVVLGYDQKPSDGVVQQELKRRGKEHVKVVRLEPYRPE